MGLMSRLFGKRERPKLTERVWLTTPRKLEDLAAQVRAAQENGAYPVVVTHFKATEQRVLDAFETAALRFHIVETSAQFPPSITDEMRRDGTALLLSSHAIPASVREARLAEPKDASLSPVSVHLAEHYPLPERDRYVFNLDKTWRMPMTFTCYTALDEPWLRLFGVERVRRLFGGLGMDEQTCLSRPELARAIQAGQRQIAQRVRCEEPCDSCEEWVSRNLPESP